MKTTVTILFILISTLTFGQTSEIYQRIGDSLLTRGKSDELIKYFEIELKKHPKNEDVLRWLGYGHIIKNNLDLGEKYYTEALTVNPKCARCYLNIGRVHSLKGDNKKALEYFDKAVNTDPNDALLYSNRARLKEMLGDKFGALRDHDKAVEIDPENPESYIQRGEYNSRIGYQSLALADYTKAIELNPNNYNPYFKRASLYYGQKRLEEAMKDINRAIELDSNQFALYTGRGAIFDVMQEYHKAISDYTKAISLNKNDFLPYLNRATSFYKLEDLDASCSDYAILKTVIENGSISDQAIIKEVNGAIQDICNSSKPSYYYQRGVGYYNLKEYHKALDIYTKGLTIFPDNAMMLSFKGNAYLALNEYEKAIEFYNLSLKHKDNILAEIKINPRFADASNEQITSFYKGSLASTYFSISECKTNLGYFDEALKEINTALELAPDIKDFNKEAYYNLRGYIHLMNGKYELAISDFDKSILINRNFPLAYVNRAIAKVSLAEKVKIRSYSIHGNFNTQPMNVNWNSPTKSSLKKSESNILSALTDCNKAIEIDNKLGYAFYIRGQIKQMLTYGDYCLDLLTAKELGLTVEDELLRNCGK
ncbi:MAG: tetratricopeptide repeat protein [Flavobacteriales bacterium]|nr:MAG: tetratricopeptide repeat protein [Flavobacteriales bacterium]